MDSNIKKLIMCMVIVVFIIFTTYLQVILYTSFKNVVKTENMVTLDSTISIWESSSNSKIDVKDESLKVKIHNVFNDIKLSRNIFIPDSQLSLPRCVINYDYLDSDNKNVMCKIIILENGNINVNGDMFKASKNVYSVILGILND